MMINTVTTDTITFYTSTIHSLATVLQAELMYSTRLRKIVNS